MLKIKEFVMDKLDIIWACLSGVALFGVSGLVSLYNKINNVDKNMSSKLDEITFQAYRAETEKQLGKYVTKDDLKELEHRIIENNNTQFEVIIDLLKVKETGSLKDVRRR